MSNWDIRDKRVIITGGTSGIGLETAKGLSGLGAEVSITSRSLDSAEVTAQSIQQHTGNPVTGFELNLESMDSVRAFAKNFDKQKIDILINNAGMIAGKKRITEDGFEATFAANYLGPFLLTKLLIPSLKKSKQGRVINVSSELYRNAKNGLNIDDLQLANSYSSSKAYSNSKLALMLFTLELRRRYLGDGIESFALHPGVIKTAFGTGPDSSRSMGLTMKLMGPLLKTPEHGAKTSILLATESSKKLDSSWYWSETKPNDPKPFAKDEVTSERLWKATEELLESCVKK